MTRPVDSSVRFTLGGPLTPVVKTLIIINVAAYLFMMISTVPSLEIYNLLGLQPAKILRDRAWWQLITYMFIHDTGLWHILFNMLALWWFGTDIERAWGRRLFIRYYFMAGIAAGLTVLIASSNSFNVTIGASGAIMAILFAYGMSYPNRVILFMFILPMKAKYFVIIIAAMTIFAATGATQSNISHFAHLGGLLFGFLWFLYYTKRLRLPSLRKILWRKRMRGRLKIVRSDEDDNDDEQNSSPTFH